MSPSKKPEKIFDHVTLAEINAELNEIIDCAKHLPNYDSHFYVAAYLIYRDQNGKIKSVSGRNVEEAHGKGLNCCAERNCSYNTLVKNRNVEFLGVWIMGGNADQKFDPNNLSWVDCCHICQEVLSQHAAPDMSVNLIPYNEGKPHQVEIALKNVKSYLLKVPTICKYTMAEAAEITAKFKPKGIYAHRHDNLMNLLESCEKALQSLAPNKDIKELGLPPHNGDITRWLSKFSKVTGIKIPGNTEAMGVILGLMRNQIAAECDEDRANIGRIESSIVRTEKGNYFACTTVHGKDLPKADEAFTGAMDLAQSSTGNRQKLTHTWIMGDPISYQNDRFTLTPTQLYIANKRAVRIESVDGKTKYSDMQINLYAPQSPSIKTSIDTRPLEEKIESTPAKNKIWSARLTEVIGPDAFPSAKLMRAEQRERDIKTSSRG